MADFLFGQSPTRIRVGELPFKHSLHGVNIGLECEACHTGARSLAHAYMPAKSDCMNCHRLPLTENPGIETLDSVLANAPSEPWTKKSDLPDHVVFHHGVHATSGVGCVDCHKSMQEDVYGGEKFDMKSCLACHRGESFKNRHFKSAATYCGACHR